MPKHPGDDGFTLLCGGRHVPKTHQRCEACGTLDELAAALGRVRCHVAPIGDPTAAQLEQILRDLLAFGAALAGAAAPGYCLALKDTDTDRLEEWINESEAVLEPPKELILVIGTELATLLHQARTVCRWAERRVLAVNTVYEPVAGYQAGVRYLNRLSDLCFVWARLANHYQGVTDALWR